MLMPQDSDKLRSTLRPRLREKVTDLAEEVRKNAGDVPAESLASVQRVAELTHLQSDLMPPRPPCHCVMAASLAVTVAIVSVLLLVHVRETEIELDLIVS